MKEKDNLTTRQLNALETREALFKSAITLFGKKGYHNVSVDEIVALAGTSKGTFYTYFKSKGHVVIEQFKQIDDHYIKVSGELHKYKTASEKLLFFVKEQLSFTENKLGVETIQVLYSCELSEPEDRVSLNTERPLVRIVQNIIEEGQRSGEFRTDLSSDELVRIVTRCMRSVFFDWSISWGAFNFTEDGCRFFSLFVIKGLLK